MRILADDTNPENNDSRVYLSVIEVPDDVEIMEDYPIELGPKTTMRGISIDSEYIWGYKGKFLTKFAVDLNPDLDRLWNAAEIELKKYFACDAIHPNPFDKYVVCSVQLASELIYLLDCDAYWYLYT